MRKNWVISQLFYPEETSTAYIMTKITEMLAERSTVNVICGSSNYQSINLQSKKLIHKDVKIYQIKTPLLNKNNLFHRIILFSYFTLSVFIKLLFKVKKNDTVIMVTNPPTLLFTTALLKCIKQFKFIVILQDIFPENAAASGLINDKSLLYRITLKAMNYGYKKADKLFACGSDMAEHFIRKGIKSENIIIIPNWADQDVLESFETINRNEYFNLNLNDKVVIEFAGNIGRVQGLETFIKIFKQSTNKKLLLLIIGDGANKKNLINFVIENKLDNVIFFPSKPRHEQKYFLKSCNIGLITLCEGMYGLGVPSKAYNLMASSKPILYIGDKKSEIDNYINQNKMGWSFSWGEEKEILHFLNNMNEQKELIIYGTNARDFASNNFTEEIVLKKYKEHLN
jgi:glycosyltransferase involved in cell wall biosynthesis